MAIHVYNSLTNKKEEFVPLKKNKVGMYVCGVTVYDEPHIGHGRGGFIFDVIKNYLGYRGYQVKYVKNITDVDDKIIERARQETKSTSAPDLKDVVRELAARYLRCYQENMSALGVREATIEPRATEHIEDMINLIRRLEEKGFAYEAGGSVYFRVSKFSDYGKLSNQKTNEMKKGLGAASGKEKEDPLDFALWKAVKEEEPAWDSPWGEGRPGWHIECSAMSMKYLGETFDIHGGGRDLIFPHHENEIAQSEAATEKKFARYWLHNGLLTIEGQKMSKSLGNFVSIKELLEKYHPEVLKLFFLSAHYRSPIDFSFKKMEAAQSQRERFYILFDKIDRLHTSNGNDKGGFKEIHELPIEIDKARNDFFKAMDDDFNTPAALAVLSNLVGFANKFIEDSSILQERKVFFLEYIKSTIIELGEILGLLERMVSTDAGLSADMLLLLKERDKARQTHNFEKADKIRTRLAEEGIVLEDGSTGTTWRRR